MAESTGLLLLNAEDNDLSGLTITEEGSNDLTITSGASAHGSLGYNFAFSGLTGENLLYSLKQFSTGSDIYARCYFYIPSAFSSNTNNIGTIYLKYGSFSSNNVAYVRLYNNAGTITVQRFYYYINTGITYTSLTSAVSRDAWHYIEIRYKSGAGDGVAECWLDGNKIASNTGLTNNTYEAGYVSFGNYEAGVPTADAPMYFDDIKVDSSYIGAYSDVSSYSGILKRWNGSAWVKEPLKYWNGVSWTTKPLKRYNGSAWVTIDTTGV